MEDDLNHTKHRWILTAALVAAGTAGAAQLSDVKHFIVIYQENWSFDGLLGKFPGAEGIAAASSVSRTQVDSSGLPYSTLPWNDVAHFGQLSLPNGPWDMTAHLDPDASTADLVHRFYHQQWQIHEGRNDRYVAGSDAKGLAMSYVDASNLPLGILGKEGVVFDHFFHSAFGGSFLNHQWLIAARTPRWPRSNPLPASRLTRFDAAGNRLTDGFLTPDSFAVNTVQPYTWPYSPGTQDSLRLPPLDEPTIADRLDQAGVSWAWYAGGYDSARAGRGNSPAVQYQYHHQPFNYYRKFADTAGAYRKSHLKDESAFFSDLASGKLPAVVWIKPEGERNEHPGYATLVQGMNHVKALVDSLKARPEIWKHTVVLITYDENGGRWDHVAPPVVDKWGPGARVPAVLLSPLARHGVVDKRQYETVSSLAFIEKRWNLRPLSNRDSLADPFTGAFDFCAPRWGKPEYHHSRKALARCVGGVVLLNPDPDRGTESIDIRGARARR